MIYKCETRPVSRARAGGGQRSAVATAAYKAGVSMTDERTGKTYNYNNKRGIEHSEIIAPHGETAPKRGEIWNMAEAREKRFDARTARDFIVALHPEDTVANIRIARRFGEYLATRFNTVVDFSIHEPADGGDERNRHAHYQMPTREFRGGELGNKTTLEMSDTTLKKRGLPSGRAQIKEIREVWQNIVNEELAKRGHDEKIDARSLKAQGSKKMPHVHLGPDDTAAERRGEETERGNYNRLIDMINAAQAELDKRERKEQKPKPIFRTGLMSGADLTRRSGPAPDPAEERKPEPKPEPRPQPETPPPPPRKQEPVSLAYKADDNQDKPPARRMTEQEQRRKAEYEAIRAAADAKAKAAKAGRSGPRREDRGR